MKSQIDFSPIYKRDINLKLYTYIYLFVVSLSINLYILKTPSAQF